MTAALLTHLSATPVTIVIPRIFPVFTARWISTRPRWRPASALDSGALVPELEPPPARHHRFSPPTWQSQGLCARLPAAESDLLFFGIEVREAPGLLIAAANKAREICARCPVAATCLTNALVEDERYGVWGGTSGRQREKLRLRLAAGATVEELVRVSLPTRELTT